MTNCQDRTYPYREITRCEDDKILAILVAIEEAFDLRLKEAKKALEEAEAERERISHEVETHPAVVELNSLYSSPDGQVKIRQMRHEGTMEDLSRRTALRT